LRKKGIYVSPSTISDLTRDVLFLLGSLVKWVKGVYRYHTTLISKVKPLHDKVEQTSVAIGKKYSLCWKL